MPTTTTPERRARLDAIAAEARSAAFRNRRGHGGGPCSRRVMTPREIEVMVLAALLEAERFDAHGRLID